MPCLLGGQDVEHPPFAQPDRKAGDLIIGQTANILFYLASRFWSGPDEAGPCGPTSCS